MKFCNVWLVMSLVTVWFDNITTAKESRFFFHMLNVFGTALQMTIMFIFFHWACIKFGLIDDYMDDEDVEEIDVDVRVIFQVEESKE